MVKTMVSCKFTLKPTQWSWEKSAAPSCRSCLWASNAGPGCTTSCGTWNTPSRGCRAGRKKRPRKGGNGDYINDGYINGYMYDMANIHPASRGVAAHTAGLFRSVRGAKGGVEYEKQSSTGPRREFSLFPPWRLPTLGNFRFSPPWGLPKRGNFHFSPVGASQAKNFHFPPRGGSPS